MGPSRSYWNGTSALQPEEITSKNFMSVLSIKVPIQKKSGNLFNDPHISRYIYIYIEREKQNVTPKMIYVAQQILGKLE